MLRPSLTLEAKRIKLDRRAQGLVVYDGGLGESPFPAPKSMVQALRDHAERKEYTDTAGIAELRALVPGRLLLGNGLKPLLYTLQKVFTLSFPEKYIFHITPAWVSYMEQTSSLSSNRHAIHTSACTNWKITPELLEAALTEAPTQSLIFFNNPTNPTGSIYSTAEVKALADVFRRYDAIVLSDAIYDGIVFDSEDCGDIAHYYDNVISGNSLSKTFSCGGYRLGWLNFGPSSSTSTSAGNMITSLHDQCHAAASMIYSWPSISLQYVAVASLEGYVKDESDVAKHVLYQREVFGTIGKFCFDRLTKDMGLTCSQPQAAWYLFVNFDSYRDALAGRHVHSSSDLSLQLLQDTGFITVPGSAFDCEPAELSLRFSYIDIDVSYEAIENKSVAFDRVRQAMDVLEQWLTQLKTQN